MFYVNVKLKFRNHFFMQILDFRKNSPRGIFEVADPEFGINFALRGNLYRKNTKFALNSLSYLELAKNFYNYIPFLLSLSTNAPLNAFKRFDKEFKNEKQFDKEFLFSNDPQSVSYYNCSYNFHHFP